MTRIGLQRLDRRLLRGALDIAGKLGAAGHQALFAGGVVRDLLLGREAGDIDIASSAPPEEVERLFEKTIPVGRQFGVVMVVQGGLNYEVTTFRSEGEYRDGRHPSRIEFSDARDDAARRDFTVNALFLDPFRREVIDYVGGRQDLAAGILRTVGDPARRFAEDKLRILRAVRFACRLGFDIEEETWRQVRAHAGQLAQVSWERISDEVIRILTGPEAARGLRLMLDSGLMEAILPEVAAMHGVPQPPRFHPEGDVFAHTCLLFKLAGRVKDPALALGMLLHDVGKPPTYSVGERIRFNGHAEEGARMSEAIARRLRLSNELREQVVDLVRQHLKFIEAGRMRESTLKRFLRQEGFEKHLELHYWDCLASHGDLSTWEFCRRKLEEFANQPKRPEPLIGGDDLIEMGFQPGPVFSEILTALEDAQLEGRLESRQEALDWVLKEYGDRR